MHLVKNCCEKLIFSIRVIIELSDKHIHKLSIHQELGFLNCLENIVLHFGKSELTSGREAFVWRHSAHSTHSAHHLRHFEIHARKLVVLALISIRHRCTIIHKIKSIRTAQARHKVPRRNHLHLDHQLSRLLPFCHNMSINPVISLKKISKLIFHFLF